MNFAKIDDHSISNGTILNSDGAGVEECDGNGNVILDQYQDVMAVQFGQNVDGSPSEMEQSDGFRVRRQVLLS